MVLRDVSELVGQQAELAETSARLTEQSRLDEELRLRPADEAVRDPLAGTRIRRWLDVGLPAALAAADARLHAAKQTVHNRVVLAG
ncbi:hypothetical protein [Kineococcus sp. G2]|uniref:hypothetical protein n=1 Tax=Kineococcus sp. G2 TaxID=3127484 RepID=UPI00301C2767